MMADKERPSSKLRVKTVLFLWKQKKKVSLQHTVDFILISRHGMFLLHKQYTGPDDSFNKMAHLRGMSSSCKGAHHPEY
jgi:hypothetical protein